MKDGTGARPRRAAAALILALAVAALSAPLAARRAYASVDLGQPCSLTVNIGASLPEDEQRDLYEADIVVDLYRIADAVPASGYDSFGWEVIEPFRSEGVSIDSSAGADGWKSVADRAAEVALGDIPKGEDAAKGSGGAARKAPSPKGEFMARQVFYGNPANSQITDMKAGLYLVIPHGSGIEEYVAAKANTSGDVSRVTVAESNRYIYSFYPELVSLPNRPVAADGSYGAADGSSWVTDASVDLSLKFSREERTGNLEITKDLLTYAAREKTGRTITDPATFVFEVSVYESRQAYEHAESSAPLVYHDFVSIVFDGNGDYGITGASPDEYGNTEYGRKKAVVKGLPIGSYAVVEEVYTGIYANTGGAVKEHEIVVNDDDNTIGVEFVNDYGDKHGGGGSVTNRFTFSSSDSKWGWEQVTDDSVDGEVIQSAQ